MKKVCFIQHNLGGGGAERRVATLSNYFVSLGYNVDIGLYGKPNVAYELDPKVKLTYICRDAFEYHSGFEKAIYKIKTALQKLFLVFPTFTCEKLLALLHIKNSHITASRMKNRLKKKNDLILPFKRYIKNRPDSVFITMMISTYIGVMDIIEEDYRKKRIDNPYIVMDCSDPKRNADEITSKRRNYYYATASKSVVQTQGALEYFPEQVQSNMVIIPNPVRDDLPDSYEGIRKKTVVNYCRLTKQKNLTLLISAFADFHKAYPDYTLQIYGEGEKKEELDGLIRSLNLESCAKIHSFDSHVHEKIVDAGMYVSTSDWEGFPNSVLEALSIGLPVISTDCDFGPRDLIENDKNGILIPLNDKEALVKAMCKIAEDGEFADRISREARKTREKYSPQIIGDMWIELIERISM